MVFELHHSFKEDVLVPYAGIKNNIKFFEQRNGQHVITADGVKCKVVWMEVRNILDLEEQIRSYYMSEPWDFLQTWHKAKPDMISLDFVHMRLKRLTAADEEEETKAETENATEMETENETENNSDNTEPEPERKPGPEPSPKSYPKNDDELLF